MTSILVLIIGINISLTAYSESNFSDPFQGQTVQGSQGGIVQRTLDSTLQDPNSLQYDGNNDGRGREYKAQSAADDSNHGKNVAAGTGAALIASGVPLLASPLTMAQGITLITMGGIELGQAGADSGTQTDNQSQKDLLTYDENIPVNPGAGSNGSSSGGLSPSDRAAITDQLQTTGLNDFLTGRGVNSDNFLDNLLSGNLRDFDTVADALSLPNNFSQEEKEKAQAEALKEFETIAENRDNLGFEESGKGFLGGGRSPSDLAQSEKADPALGNASRDLSSTDVAGGRGALGDEKNTPDVDPNAVLNSLLGKKKGAEDVVANLPVQLLRKLGLFKGSKYSNIFVKARQNYQRYGHWRKRQGKTTALASASRD